MRLRLITLAAFAAGAVLAAPAARADANVVLVLDASGSMWGQVEGRTKVEIAREAVAGLVADWPAADTLGLVAYGHRRKGDCADIETLIAPGPLDAAAFQGRVNGLNPTGMTPLSAAVVHAADLLRSSERKATVILVSDGEETCDLDPCQVGRELEQRGVDFTAHVIGFDVAEPAHQAQLRCLAENTGGRYFNAGDAGELAGALGSLAAVSTQPALPPATASLSAPAQATVATAVEIAWEGPGDEGDYVGLYRGDREVAYALIEAGTRAVRLRTATATGDYELRYVSPRRAEPVLARRPIALVEAVAAIEAPAQAMAGSTLRFRARGPGHAGHWVGIALPDAGPDAHLGYAWIEADEAEYRLRAPAEPGDYELRVVLAGDAARIAARQPVRVTAAQARIAGPAEGSAGGQVEVEAEGPDGEGHWLGVAPAGSEPGAFRTYTYYEPGTGTYRLALPDETGDYELRFVLAGETGDQVIASQPIRVR